jgi:SAM-dependent MidA family methyltransferase
LLAERLRDLIRARGPIPFRDWMEAALYDPAGGYYNRTDLKRWGREGDYRTSPERTALFAATFARYFEKLYDELGRPAQWTIVEGGAGDGRFAHSMLRAFAEAHPDVFEATQYCLEEVSADSVSRAQQTLIEFRDRVSFAGVTEVETGIYFSNELVDAFPVHRLTSEGELYVTLDSDDNFTWTTGEFSTPRLAEFLEEHSIQLAPNQIIEVNLGIEEWLASVAAKIKNGFIITVDYGDETPELYGPILRPNGTLRAFSRHGFIDNVLLAPGDYDITSSVNWTQVKAAGKRLGLEVVEFASQDRFLLSAGLLNELHKQLAQTETQPDKVRLAMEAKEMILPGGMASSFQVLVQRRV